MINAQVKRHESMRGYFAYELYQHMSTNKDIWLVTADLGYGMFDFIRDDFPDRFINTGAAEMAASDICVGLALEGKIPFFYTITPFFWRCAETLRTYIAHENIPVKCTGSGRDDDYKHDGFSHNAKDIIRFMDGFSIQKFYPETKEEIPETINAMIESKNPCFLSLRR